MKKDSANKPKAKPKLKLTFKDISKLAYNRLCVKYKFKANKLSRSKSVHSLNQVFTRVSPILEKLHLFTRFESMARDVWSCIFWRARKDLERDIEVLVEDLFRVWKSEDGSIICSTQPGTGLVTWVKSQETLTSTLALYLWLFITLCVCVCIKSVFFCLLVFDFEIALGVVSVASLEVIPAFIQNTKT